MPELPEVETIRLQLERFLVGRKIVGVEVKKPKSFPNDKKLILGAKVIKVRRFGKVTVLDLNNKYSLLIHLKLTGQLLTNGVIGPYTRVVISLDKGKLVFNDLRIFGWVRIAKTDQILGDKLIGKMGPEPFKDLTLEKFRQVVSSSSRPIKIVLMDQEKISGVGNIYANDALWLARVKPQRSAKDLRNEEIANLYNCLLQVLKNGLKYGGASDQYYIKPDGTKGEYQKHFLVYARDGEPCERCHKAGIQKVFLGGRGTYFCPACQKI